MWSSRDSTGYLLGQSKEAGLAGAGGGGRQCGPRETFISEDVNY